MNLLLRWNRQPGCWLAAPADIGMISWGRSQTTSPTEPAPEAARSFVSTATEFSKRSS